MLTMTIKEIADLAESAGLVLAPDGGLDEDSKDTEITIIDCPKEGVADDDGKPTFFKYVAYFTDYPEEGCFPLGDELAEAP